MSKHTYFHTSLLAFSMFVAPLARAEEDHKHDHDKEEKHEHDEKAEEGHAHEEKGHSHEEKGHSHEEKGHSHEEGGHGHGEGSKFGPGKAIEEVKGEGKQFRLSQKAVSIMSLKTEPLRSVVNERARVPASSLVFFQEEVGVYVLRDGWFQLIELELLNSDGKNANVKTKYLKPTDLIVTGGVALLRIAHLEASGQGGQGHVH